MLQSLPESSQHLNTTLEDEWNFTRSICIYVIGGEAEAGKRFRSVADNGKKMINRSLLSFMEKLLVAGQKNDQQIFIISHGETISRWTKNDQQIFIISHGETISGS
jgi:hypothetical protein